MPEANPASPYKKAADAVCGYNKEHKKHSNRKYNEAKATNQKRNDAVCVCMCVCVCVGGLGCMLEKASSPGS
jgi:hypothetical protein